MLEPIIPEVGAESGRHRQTEQEHAIGASLSRYARSVDVKFNSGDEMEKRQLVIVPGLNASRAHRP
jgi:hypothetical protein